MALGDTTELLEDIRERGSIPSADLRFTDAKLLKAATKEMREGCVPLLHAAKSEHLVTPYTVAVTSGTAEYRVPPKAIGGGGLRDVVWTGTGGQPVSLREIPVEELPMWGNGPGTPVGYYMRSYAVVLVPTPNVTGTLSLPYYLRPNELVATTAATTVTALETDTEGLLSLTLDSVEPLGFTDGEFVSSVGIDVLRATPAFETLSTVTGCTISSGGVILSGQVSASAGVAVGDYVALLGTSPVVQLPVEMLGLLAARTVRRALKAAGDARWKDYEADVAELEARAVQWLSPRNDGEVSSVSPFSSGLFVGVLR